MYSITTCRRAVNSCQFVLILSNTVRQPLLWVLSGILIGVGFVSAFSGGLLFLVVGLVLAAWLGIKYRYRRRWRGWSGLLYGSGASVALLLFPSLLRQPPCVQGTGSGCYQGFTTGVFLVALALALAGLGFGILELRGWRRSLGA